MAKFHGFFLFGLCAAATVMTGCEQSPPEADGISGASPMVQLLGDEMPVRQIPNMPPSGEAYYAPDNYHLIVQTMDPEAQHPEDRDSGPLTYIYTDDGTVARRINDRGQDACSWVFPDQKRILWTSTRDNRDMPLGDWSDPDNYPQGAELYTSDLYGKDVARLTDNEYYEAEVSISPDGQWITFAREIKGNVDLWRMRPDGSDEQQITYTTDWQPGAPIYMRDSETIMFQGWHKGDVGKEVTPMTVFTINHDGTNLKQRTFDNGMYWGPAPIADGRHYLYTSVIEDGNYELFVGDLAGGEPIRLTWRTGFDGMKSISHDGQKMLFSRSGAEGPALYVHVMELSALNMGPENYKGIPDTPVPEDAILVDNFTTFACKWSPC